jgi:glycogen phosphorylase
LGTRLEVPVVDIYDGNEGEGHTLPIMKTIAYFSMEIGVTSAIPTYCGGLGVLAGDTLRSAADLGIPMVGMTLLFRKGYFHQNLDERGQQKESPSAWDPRTFMESLPARVSLELQGRKVEIGVWRYWVEGVSRQKVPVFFLDTALPENDPYDQTLTDSLYGGDHYYRLCQEAILGLGGVAMLRALGYENIQAYHMNEGHSALLTLALLQEETRDRGLHNGNDADKEAVRERCIFTTHTPVPSGHDQFPMEMVEKVLGRERTQAISEAHCCLDGTLNMTYLALFFSHYINGVALRHGELSQTMFPHYPINSITNGIHAATWASPPFRDLFDRQIPEWRRDNLYLRYAIDIPPHEIGQAHQEAKRRFLEEVKKRTGLSLHPEVFTIGFARRTTPYKRPTLLFTDLNRLENIASRIGPLQIVLAGKAHPQDEGGKSLIRQIFEIREGLREKIQMVYLEEYDMDLAKVLCSGVDLWLNTPQKPQEASGTSGMKAAMNGVPSLSVLDGWWIEGWVEGVTGWAIGENLEEESSVVKESDSLYDKLEQEILPLYYGRPQRFAKVMQSTIALNASFFNTQRMMMQYVRNAYHITDSKPGLSAP